MMDIFTISQLSQYSGIKAHTIRMWEQRYNGLTPNRTEGNTRYYDNNQLRRLLNIASLKGGNFKLSQLCSKTDQELFSLVKSHQKGIEVNANKAYYITQLTAAAMDYNEPYFEKIYANCVLRFGLINSYLDVIYPMLERVGMLWITDEIPAGQEHFISNLVRQKLFMAIDSLPPPTVVDENWLLFLPEDEFHEIGLLMANYILRSFGRKVIYLGVNVPLVSINDVLKTQNCQQLLLFFVHQDHTLKLDSYVTQLQNIASGKELFLAGKSLANSRIKSNDKVNYLTTVDDLIKQLTKPNV